MSIITLNSGTQAHFVSQAQDVQAQINLDRLSDVTVTNVQDNQVLKYSAKSTTMGKCSNRCHYKFRSTQ